MCNSRWILHSLVIALNLGVVLSQSTPANRLYSGGASCICGIDPLLLERLETILKALPAQSCPAPTSETSETAEPPEEINFLSSLRPTSTNRPTSGSNPYSHQNYNEIRDTGSSLISSQDPTDLHQQHQQQHQQQQQQQPQHQQQQQQQHQTHQPNSDDTLQHRRPSENESSHLVGAGTTTRPSDSPVVGGDVRPERPETQIGGPPPGEDQSSEGSRENTGPINSGFLNGLAIGPILSHNQALAKLNQSTQSVDEKDMTTALESTVPNLVSNIFHNIKNLTLQTEQNPDRPQPSTLTSIDGSSVEVDGDTKDQITANGQKLFDIWLEQQLATLNLTAAMANHIRKSAGVLFRRIIKQYVDRVEKMGGRVEQNIQRATQMALNNTQTLIAFLLKNYVNFAAGIMQILGEQVSRVGKQIDSTGDTIAHLSLNPFDIISNVMESLPNPSDYSNYFRNVGKQLLGDVMSIGSGSGGGSNGQQQNSGSPGQPQGGGLITKTIGAITKLGSWFG